MGLCDFLKQRQVNREADRPMAEDGDVVPDIVLPMEPDPERPPVCRCTRDHEGLRWHDKPVRYLSLIHI